VGGGVESGLKGVCGCSSPMPCSASGCDQICSDQSWCGDNPPLQSSKQAAPTPNPTPTLLHPTPHVPVEDHCSPRPTQRPVGWCWVDGVMGFGWFGLVGVMGYRDVKASSECNTPAPLFLRIKSPINPSTHPPIHPSTHPPAHPPIAHLWVVVVTTSAYSKGDGTSPAATSPEMCAMSASSHAWFWMRMSECVIFLGL